MILTPVAGAAIKCVHRSAILIVRLSVALRVRWRVRGVHVRWLPHMALIARLGAEEQRIQ